MTFQKTLLVISIAAAITLTGCNAVTPDSDTAALQRSQDEIEIAESDAAQPTSPPISQTLQLADQVRIKVTKEKRAAGAMITEGFAPAISAQSGANFHGIQPDIRPASEELDRENYHHFDDNPVKLVSEHPVSTFSIDVDTGAYANVRRMINSGQLPRQDAVRVEELINYFNYDYPLSKNGEAFSVTTEIGSAPWNPNAQLLHIGIKGADIDKSNLPASNLVFLVDVSGSMRSANKLELLKSSLKLLSKQMRAEDKVSLVVYAGSSGAVLEPTSGKERFKIINALDGLTAGGSTNGASGIQLAYQMAQQGYIKDGINRVILATDGDFNVGTTNFEALKELVEEKRKSGISLTTLGFGTGNYNDHLMEQLADSGNGNYAYIDTLNEAQKVLVDEMSSTLNTIASDVKIQIEFNPDIVKEYRLIGYENRQLKREDFNNDKVDAGEIGAGHTVTALYEIIPHGSSAALIEPLRYQNQTATQSDTTIKSSELAFLKMRYKKPGESESTLLQSPVPQPANVHRLAEHSDRYRFSAAVAGFGQLLRGATYTRDFNYDDVMQLARGARGNDRFGYRGEFIKLVNLTQSLSTPQQTASIEHVMHK